MRYSALLLLVVLAQMTRPRTCMPVCNTVQRY
jgi:hypothetical protein